MQPEPPPSPSSEEKKSPDLGDILSLPAAEKSRCSEGSTGDERDTSTDGPSSSTPSSPPLTHPLQRQQRLCPTPGSVCVPGTATVVTALPPPLLQAAVTAPPRLEVANVTVTAELVDEEALFQRARSVVWEELLHHAVSAEQVLVLPTGDDANADDSNISRAAYTREGSDPRTLAAFPPSAALEPWKDDLAEGRVCCSFFDRRKRCCWIASLAVVAIVLFAVGIAVLVAVLVVQSSRSPPPFGKERDGGRHSRDGSQWRAVGPTLWNASSGPFALAMSGNGLVLAIGDKNSVVHVWRRRAPADGEDPGGAVAAADVGFMFDADRDSDLKTSDEEWERMGPPLTPGNLSNMWTVTDDNYSSNVTSYGYFGLALSLSGAGDRLVCGAFRGDKLSGEIEYGFVRIYDYMPNSTTASPWVSPYPDLTGPVNSSRFGHSVALSADGGTLVVGDPKYSASATAALGQGSVHAYRLNSAQQEWLPLGQILVGEEDADGLGLAVCVSDDGSVVMALMSGNNNGTIASGSVKVWEYSGASGKWQQLGATFRGAGGRDGDFGATAAMSGLGTTVAVSGNVTSEFFPGYVRVFRFDKGSAQWRQLGSDLVGETSSEGFGYTLSLSQAGTTLAVGVPSRDGLNGALRTGGVQVFTHNASTDLWSPLGIDLQGTMSSDNFGQAVEMSMDGTVVSASSSGWILDGNGTLAGYTKVFELGNNRTRRDGQPSDS